MLRSMAWQGARNPWVGRPMRGAGDTRTTMWITTLSNFCVRVPVVYLLGVVFGLGLNGVWFGLCGELVFRGLIFASRFMHGGWAKTQV